MYWLRFTLISLLQDVLYTPLWWYSDGLWWIGNWCLRASRQTWRLLGVDVWIKHIFTPMFRQYDWQGRLISFLMRVVQIIGRGFGFFVMMFIYISIVALWIFIPIAIIYRSAQHIFFLLSDRFAWMTAQKKFPF